MAVVTLWRGDLDTGVVPQVWMLSAQEWQLAQAMRCPVARMRRLRGFVFLRQILGRYLSMPAVDVPLLRPPGRKPYVACIDDFDFNLTHTGAFVLVAVAYGLVVGVDAEDLPDDFDIREVVAPRLSRGRQRALRQLDDHAARQRALRYWVRHEALVKCLDQPARLSGRLDVVPPVDVRVVDVPVQGNRKVALAVRGQGTWSWRMQEWPTDHPSDHPSTGYPEI